MTRLFGVDCYFSASRFQMFGEFNGLCVLLLSFRVFEDMCIGVQRKVFEAFDRVRGVYRVVSCSQED